MSHYNLLAQLFADGALPRVAFNALPDAPVQPHVERRFRLRDVTAARRARFVPSAARVATAECAPAG